MLLTKLTKVSLAYGVHHLLDQADLQIDDNERVCIIGRNGTGKTTLLNVLAGKTAVDSGEVWSRDGLRLAYLTQDSADHGEADVYTVVAGGLPEVGSLLAEYHRVSHLIAHADKDEPQLMKQLARLQQQLEHHDGWNLDQKVAEICDRLNLPSDDRFADLSGGTQRRVLLGRALVCEPDLLLLDEPTNHLDIERIQWLEDFLKKFSGTIVFVTHDRAFLKNLATRIVELDRGILTSFPGNYARYEMEKQKALEVEQQQNALFDKKLAEEERWIRQGVKARRTRNEGRVRALQAMRQERSQRREKMGNVKLNLETAQTSGKLVAVIDDMSFAWPDGTRVVSHFSTQVLRGDRIGIIGPNGCGKSTLIKLLLQNLQPQSGSIELGTNLEIVYFDQQRQQLDPDKSVLDNLNLGTDYVTINGKSRHVMGYLQDFLFSPQRAQSPVRALSGGEQNRLLLAQLFTKPANFLILDEPTNDLDVESLELLEELVTDFDGTIVLVSHDREFLDNIVTSVWVFDDDSAEQGTIHEYVGGYSDWYNQYQQRQQDNALPEKERNESGKTSTAESGDVQISGTTQSAAPKKLSYKEQRELEELPIRIEQLETEKAELEQHMTQSGFYQQDEQTIKDSLQRLDNINQQLDHAYQAWERLESRV